MDEERSASQVSWGARINTRERHDASDCPAWAGPASRDRWTQKGLIVWQEETQRIVKLSATYALQILDGLRSDEAWTEHGITIGEPMTRLSLGEPKQEPKPVLANPIQLSPRQTKALLGLLERNEVPLREMSEKEVQKGSRALGRAYCLILDYGERSNKESDTPED